MALQSYTVKTVEWVNGRALLLAWENRRNGTNRVETENLDVYLLLNGSENLFLSMYVWAYAYKHINTFGCIRKYINIYKITCVYKDVKLHAIVERIFP